MKTIILILSSIASAILYRMGGAHGYNTKYRDIGCSLVGVLFSGYFISWDWTLILCFGLSWGALSTYWKKGQTAKWYHWLFTGLGYSVALLPFVIAEGLWFGFLVRSLVLSLATMIWSESNRNAVWEEMGRGVLIVLTIPLLTTGG